MKEATQPIQVRLPLSVIAEISRRGQQEDRTVPQMVRILLKQALEKKK